MTLADGTPVGAASGSTPTLIPAGYYALVFSGPGGCSSLPNFHRTGPGTSIVTSMSEGAVLRATNAANFLPTSTYTWIDDAFPSVVHTFSTSSEIISVPPPVTTTTTSSSPKGKAVTSQDVVGSAVVPFRGTLSGGVKASGMLSLAYKGKSVGSLKAGRYRIAVTDGSSTKGFVLQEAGRKAIAVTGATFMGKRTASVNLTAGKWLSPARARRATPSLSSSRRSQLGMTKGARFRAPSPFPLCCCGAWFRRCRRPSVRCGS